MSDRLRSVAFGAVSRGLRRACRAVTRLVPQARRRGPVQSNDQRGLRRGCRAALHYRLQDKGQFLCDANAAPPEQILRRVPGWVWRLRAWLPMRHLEHIRPARDPALLEVLL